VLIFHLKNIFSSSNLSSANNLALLVVRYLLFSFWVVLSFVVAVLVLVTCRSSGYYSFVDQNVMTVSEYWGCDKSN